jgi:dihydroneopterin aldolase
MSDSIFVRGIRAEGRHGLESEGERNAPQTFIVDIELRVDLRSAAAADTLDKAIDYREISRATRAVIERESFELVEALADAIAHRILTLGGDSVRVRISKPNAAAWMRVGEVAVVVER